MKRLPKDEKDYREPPVKWHRGRRTLARLPKRLDYLTDREYLDALCRDLKRLLDVETARTDYWRSKSKLHLAKALRYSALLDQLTGKVESEDGYLAELENWIAQKEAKVQAAKDARKGE